LGHIASKNLEEEEESPREEVIEANEAETLVFATSIKDSKQ